MTVKGCCLFFFLFLRSLLHVGKNKAFTLKSLVLILLINFLFIFFAPYTQRSVIASLTEQDWQQNYYATKFSFQQMNDAQRKPNTLIICKCLLVTSNSSDAKSESALHSTASPYSVENCQYSVLSNIDSFPQEIKMMPEVVDCRGINFSSMTSSIY